MKKVLFITYYWPPAGGPGVHRSIKTAKYLREFGWEPTIYAPENAQYPSIDNSLASDIPENLEVIKHPIWEPYNLLGKKNRPDASLVGKPHNESAFKKAKTYLLEWARGNLFIPDPRVFWVKPSVKFLLDYLQIHSFDAIMTTAPPYSVSLIGLEVQKKTGIPWLADFRDLWTDFYYFDSLHLTSFASAKQKSLEKKVLNVAAAVVAVGPILSETFASKVNREVETVYNGYDPENSFPDVKPVEKFRLGFIGSLYPQNISEDFWKGVKMAIDQEPNLKKDIDLFFAGNIHENQIKILEEQGLMPYCSIIGYIPHKEALENQVKSHVLLTFVVNMKDSKSVINGKLYELLKAGRYILCICSEKGDSAAILEETNSGQAISFFDPIEARDAILERYQLYKKGIYEIEQHNLIKYSKRTQVENLSKILDRISQKKQE